MNKRSTKNKTFAARIEETESTKRHPTHGDSIVNIVHHNKLIENGFSVEPSIVEKNVPLCFMYSPKESKDG